MTSWLYLLALLASIFCMGLIDYRWRLFWWADARRAGVVTVIALGLFVAWDLLGIHTGSFSRGDSPWMLGVEIVPEFPVEEIFFILFFCYLTMNLSGYIATRRVGRRGEGQQ